MANNIQGSLLRQAFKKVSIFSAMKARCTVVKLNIQFHEESAIFSVDTVEIEGKTIIATAGGDSAIRLWEYTYTGEEPKEEFEYKTALSDGCAIKHIFTLEKHKGSVNTLQFSRDRKYLITGGDTGAVCLWEIDKVLGSTPAEEDNKYKGRPTIVREPDGSDIYEVKWFRDRIVIGTSSGRIEQYTVKAHEEAKENTPIKQREKETKSTGSIKIRVIEEYAADTTRTKCVSSRQAHRDVVQGIACSREVFATFGNDRVVKIFTEEGKIVQKVSKKSLITDKHTLFFRRLSFSSDGILYLPSGIYEGRNTVHILSPPEYKITQTIGPFPSPTACTHVPEGFLAVSEGRNFYLFETEGHSLLFRIADCTFLPITDIKTVKQTKESLSLLVSSSDGFLTNIIVYIGE